MTLSQGHDTIVWYIIKIQHGSEELWPVHGFGVCVHCVLGPPRWRRGSGLDFGSEDPGSIPRLPSPRVGPLWQGGKRRLRMFRCTCRGRLGTLKTPSCPWRGCPAAGQNLETGHLSRHYIAEILLNVTLNHNQQQQHRHCDLDIKDMTFGKGHDTPLGHGQ